ncbi:nucleotidyltransferase family protein [Cellulomonas sp. zg-ZUI222]|uniref:Nucleotidyltransferase family protein n=1 Tax=Cellulomonas wangleii TaxID=2816956 RepID=A0ABX8D3X9_9CELL|nr:nucleotidyltransferase family protein [Cellulomonas wangleii]MBO0920333.1 nucleotidyltransferase family protein [Cellulomonas wangleii]MBO0923235.1 nucleotidyltransferase family protein [Cellulomonas wangleii]QVI61600.1 nucleotidyltransferase family protein [Cellulomonas wangleii]
MPEHLLGLVLAAGAGTRMGRPKALCATDGVPWLHRAADALRGGGCAGVRVVLGAGADEARALVPTGTDAVVADDWARGMGASLAAGLAGLDDSPATAVVVTLVDLPDLDARAVSRVTAGPVGPGDLRRATFAGAPGHPVLLGRDHWAALRQALDGDTGARDYLRTHPPVAVDCTGLPGGTDRDTPD